MSRVILTCNAGSTNTKLATFDAATLTRIDHAVTHNAEETATWLASHSGAAIAAIGHRVVHGGREFSRPIAVSPSVLTKLKQLIPLAPLHQPAAIARIEELQKRYPGIPHIACFDTAFHRTMPDIERRLPLPQRFHDDGIQRYGFHGLSYEHVASVLPDIAPKHANGRVIVAHLGGGASVCAMKDLASVASSMGFSTLDGLMMGTRSGAIDPGVLLYLLDELKMSVMQVSDLLYREAGLLGVSGISGDMRALLASPSPAAKLAVALYCHLAARQIAGLIPAIGGLDALVFTGGIGEHAAPVREQITALLRWIGDFPVLVVPTDEELVIAQACAALLP